MTQPPPIEHSVQPYYVRQHQGWAVGNERQRHRQALFAFGEPVLFTHDEAQGKDYTMGTDRPNA